MNIKILFLLYLIFMFFLTSCDRKSEVTKTEFRILNGEWILTSFDTLGKPTYFVHPNDTIILNFQEKEILRGYSSGLCINTFGGKYETFQNNEIRISDLISTRSLCPESQYWHLVHGLIEIDRYNLTDKLELYDDEDQTKISFQEKLYRSNP